MIDMGSIGAVLSSLNAAKEIAKSMVNLHTATEIQAATVDLNGKIIDAQQQLFAVNQAQATCAERVRELEGQIAAMKNWDAEKQRYQLVAPFRGTSVFAVKKAMSNGEPPHYLCTNCFKKSEPSILQLSKGEAMMSYYVCPNPACKAKMDAGFRGGHPPKYAEDVTTEG